MLGSFFRRFSLALAVALALSANARGSEFFVSPSGSADGDGTIGNPWSLAFALSQPPAVRPGDTIWLRGGTYVGTTFTSSLTGTSTSPIKVRQYTGERAMLDGGTNPPTYSTPVLSVNGGYTWFMGFEITNSNTTRISPNTGSNPPDSRARGVYVNGPGTKIINMVIHDTGGGIGTWMDATNSEVYGNLVYYSGWDAPDRGHGHGIYAQNQAPSVKRIADNILFDQFDINLQAYTENGYIDNISLEGNIVFNGGAMSAGGLTMNLVLGGTNIAVANNPSLISNYTYSPPAVPGGGVNLGYNAGCTNATVTNNYFAGYSSLAIVNCSSVAMTANTLYAFWGGFPGITPSQYPTNTYFTTRPAGTQVFLRPNQYEPGRANIAIYNWGLASSVNVDLSSILTNGSQYEIRNAQNFFGPPVKSGTYAGGSISLPMTGLAAASPVGWQTPSPTGPEFNAFVVVTVSGAPPPTPTPTSTPPPPTPTPTPTAPPPPGTPTPPPPTTTPTQGPTNPPPYPTGTPTQPPPTATPSPVPTPPTGLGARAKLNVPVAAHVQGVGGLLFVTDLLLENPAALSVEAQLTFYPAGGGSPSQMPLSLMPGQTLRLPDVVAKFGLNNNVGALCLESSYAPSGLRMTSRTYDSVGAGTYGQAVTGRSGESADGSRFVTGLAQMSDFRTNLGAFNTTAQTVSFLILLRGSDGAIVGTTETLELSPGGQTQWSLAQRFPNCFGKGMTAEFRPVSGMAPLAYAAVVDNLSGDPTYYSATTPSSLVYLPVVSRVHGAGGTLFTSDVSIANTSDLPETVTLTFLQSDLETASPISSRVSVGPHATHQMDDVLGDLLRLGDAYGSLKIQTSGGATILVSERISTPSPTAPGTVGQQVEPVTPDGFFSRGSLLGIRQDSSFRSNIGLFNPYELGTSAALLLKAEDGRTLGIATVSVPAGRYVQKSLPTLFPGVPFPAGEVLAISLTTSQADLFAFVSVIDNVSQDPTFYPGLK